MPSRHLTALLCLLLFSPWSLAAKPLYFCNDPDWPPLDYVDSQKRPRGVAPDTLKWLVTHRLKQYRLIHWPTENWDQSLKALRNNKCQVMPEAVLTQKRLQWMLFTRPYASYPLVIIGRKGDPIIADLKQLRGKTLARQRGSMVAERLRQQIPGLKIMETPDSSSAYLSVAGGKADFTVDPAPVARAKLNQLGLGERLAFKGDTGLRYTLRMAVNKAHPALLRQLDAALENMPFAELSRIESQYITPADKQPFAKLEPFDPLDWHGWIAWAKQSPNQLILLSIGVVVFLLVLLVIRGRQKAEEAALDQLTGLPNRHLLEKRLPKLLRRAKPPKKPLSVVALDVDFFKKINDEYGHLTGDAVLKELAGVLRKQKRAGDLVVRWGGEEFLFVAPGASLKQACGLAERLRDATQRHFMSHDVLPMVTISLGVAEYRPGETMEQLIERADRALYQSKHQGRNRVSCHRGERPATTVTVSGMETARPIGARDPLA
ncbi:diguanylate cyclase [Sulfurivirga sp.]|uniref:diguanylate cyclase n=1 Tax=Sulfurivirga sp. TaxID=2614236 RepID=UPI0025E51D4A|nr:diguanylate cyclase [Sulfurivirga sp.]